MKYLNKRGWYINLKDIPVSQSRQNIIKIIYKRQLHVTCKFPIVFLHWKAPCNNGVWENGTGAMSEALKLEKAVYEELIHLHNTAKDDFQVCKNL